MTRRLLAAFLLAGFVAAALARAEEHAQADETHRSTVVARFEGGQVTVGDLEDEIAAQSRFMRQRYIDEPNRKKQLLEDTLQLALLAEEARRRGYAEHDLVVTAVKQNAVQALIHEQFDEKITAESIGPEEVAKYYETHINEFVKPEMRRASHIQLESEKEALELMEEALKADLREFRELARRRSVDSTSNMRGGDLRYFDREGTVDTFKAADAPTVAGPLAAAAFKLKEVGDVAPKPIQVDGKFSIVKLTGKREGSKKDAAEADKTIRMRLWRENRQAAIEGFIAVLRERHKPVIRAELIEAIQFDDKAPVVEGRELPPGFPTDKPAE